MDSLALTSLQIDIMRVLWRQGEATVADVHQALLPTHGLAQPTVATLLTRLEKKGAISHRTEGRQFIYAAEITEGAIRRSMLGQLTDGLFGGNVPQLMSHLLSSQDLGADDLAHVKALIAKREKEMKKKGGGT